MRAALLALPLLLAGCGGASADEAEIAFVPATGKIVAVKVQCELKAAAAPDAPPAEPAAQGECAEIIAQSRTFEFRGASVNRALEITYAYTSPLDGDIHQGQGEREQPIERPVPRVGEEIELELHPEDPAASRIAGTAPPAAPAAS